MAVKVIASFDGLRSDDSTNNVLCYEFRYRLTRRATNGHEDGGILIVAGDLTETEVNAIFQQQIADKANQESISEFNFTVNDVRGGRI